MAARQYSVTTVITVSVVLVSTLILAGISAFWVWQEYRFGRQVLGDFTRRGCTQFAIAMETPAWNLDTLQIDRLLDSYMEYPSVVTVAVELSDGKVFARTRNENWRSVEIPRVPKAGPDLLQCRQPISVHLAARGSASKATDDVLGSVSVRTTMRFVNQELRDTLYVTLAGIAISDLVLIGLLYLVMRWLVLHPLRTVRAHAAAVASGADEVGQLSSARFYGEFEQLRESLATMLALLRSRFQALSREQRRYRQLLSQMLRVQDDERRNIGRELHDSIGQSLAALEINLSLLERDASTLDAPAAQLLRESASIAKQCLAAIRTTSYLLHPPLLDELGLATALRWLVDGFRKRSDIQLHAVIPDDIARLPQETELIVFRVAQEALTNVYRHSGARSAELRLTRDAETVTLCVTDTGHGFATAEANTAAGASEALVGVGLAAMRERVREVGGVFTVRSGDDGTMVVASLPAPSG